MDKKILFSCNNISKDFSGMRALEMCIRDSSCPSCVKIPSYNCLWAAERHSLYA